MAAKTVVDVNRTSAWNIEPEQLVLIGGQS